MKYSLILYPLRYLPKATLCHPWANDLVKYREQRLKRRGYFMLGMCAWFSLLSFTGD